MTFDYSVPEKVKITMKNYVRDALEGCSDMTGTAESPAQFNLFSVTLVSLNPLLGGKDKERFYSITA